MLYKHSFLVFALRGRKHTHRYIYQLSPMFGFYKHTYLKHVCKMLLYEFSYILAQQAFKPRDK